MNDDGARRGRIGREREKLVPKQAARLQASVVRGTTSYVCLTLMLLTVGCAASGIVARGGRVAIPNLDVSPTTERIGSNAFAGAANLLRSSMEAGAFPGAVTVAGWHGVLVYLDAVGTHGVGDTVAVDTTTIYDLASVTKVVSTTTAVMLLVADGLLDIDRPASFYVPEFSHGAAAGVTVRHLLTHTSGLPAYRRLYLETESTEAALDSVFATPLLFEPGSGYVYSDLGAIILGLIVERVTGEPLDRFIYRRVFAPLGMWSTRYRPPACWLHRIAFTEVDSTRGGALRGVVHDENAYHLGHVAGHAGLFSTARDLARFAKWMLDLYHGRIDPDESTYVAPEIVREFVRRQPGPEGSTRALGWDTPSPICSTAGAHMSRQSFGHLGFTGTSMWIDPENEFFVVLLTNRVNPTRNNQLIRTVRGPLADSILAAIHLAPRP